MGTDSTFIDSLTKGEPRGLEYRVNNSASQSSKRELQKSGVAPAKGYGKLRCGAASLTSATISDPVNNLFADPTTIGPNVWSSDEKSTGMKR